MNCPFENMKQTLNNGVKTVTSHDLYPTPQDLAERMVQLAEVDETCCVLEPSAGTGNLIRAMPDCEITACEISAELCAELGTINKEIYVSNCDFLQFDHGAIYDAVIMNPPFSGGADIKHILHALTMLTSGGVLVAICANGSRQRAALTDKAEYWEDLPQGTFKSSGTLVNTALLVIRK